MQLRADVGESSNVPKVVGYYYRGRLYEDLPNNKVVSKYIERDNYRYGVCKSGTIGNMCILASLVILFLVVYSKFIYKPSTLYIDIPKTMTITSDNRLVSNIVYSNVLNEDRRDLVLNIKIGDEYFVKNAILEFGSAYTDKNIKRVQLPPARGTYKCVVEVRRAGEKESYVYKDSLVIVEGEKE